MVSFQELFDEALAAGVSPDQMRANCINEVCERLTYGYQADKRAAKDCCGIYPNGATYRQDARRCITMLKWLDTR
jgi:hypothetical protein